MIPTACSGKPLSGRSSLTTADVLVMLLPGFWWSPQGCDLTTLATRVEVSLLAFEGLGLRIQRRTLSSAVNPLKRRMTIKKYGEEWSIPLTRTSAYLITEYRGIRPKTPASTPLFVDLKGDALQMGHLCNPFFRADELLGADLPLTTMLAEFCAANTGRHEHVEAILAFRNKRWPGQDRPPEAKMWELVAMLDGTDPLKGDLRVFENERYAHDKIEALGGSDLPRSLWDLVKSRNTGWQHKRRLPETHPLLVRIDEEMKRMPSAPRAMTRERDALIEDVMPQIEALIVSGDMAAEQAAKRLGFTTKSFSWKRGWWKKGGRAASKAAYAAGPKKSQKKKRPPLTRDETKTLKALRIVRWPFIDLDIARFRQDLVDLHFPTVDRIIGDGNLKGYEAAKLFRTKATVISDLRADIEAGSPLVVMTTTDPQERQAAKSAVATAIRQRRADRTFADIARSVRADTGLRISSEFVRAVNEMERKKAKAAGEPEKKRKPRRLLRRRLGLKPTAVGLLWSLDRRRGRTLQSLAAEMGKHHSWASQVVDELVRAGFALKPRDPSDGRFRSVTLTDEGVAVKDAIVRGKTQTSEPELCSAAGSPRVG